MAAADLDDACTFIGTDNPDAAIRVADRIYTQVMGLADIPHQGRLGEVPGTRELVFHPWPYIAVYKVFASEIRIIRIRHAAQEWP